MPRYTWIGARLDRLLELGDKRKDGEGSSWASIGAEFGISESGALRAYQKHADKRALALAETSPTLVPAQPVRRDARASYVSSADVEILARIERQGLTAGFLGDPPPGRSALDARKREGLA